MRVPDTAGDVVGVRRDVRVQQPKVRVDDVIDVEEIANAVKVAHAHESPGLPASMSAIWRAKSGATKSGA